MAKGLLRSSGGGGPPGGEDGALLDMRLIRRLLPYAKRHAGPLTWSVVLLAPSAALDLVQPWVVKLAIDGPIATRHPAGLYPLGALLLLAILAQNGVQFFQNLAMQQGGQGIVHDLRVDVHRKLLSMHDRFFKGNPAGKLLTRCTSDVEGIGEMFASGFLTLFADIVLLVGICVALLFLDWQLALVTFATLPFLYAISQWFQRALRDAYREIRGKVATLNAYLQERLAGIQIVQLFAKEKRAMHEFEAKSQELMGVHFRSIALDAALYAVVDAIAHIVVAVLLAVAAKAIVGGTLSFGALVAFLDYVRRFFQPIRDLSQKIGSMQAGFASAERVFALLDEEDAVPDQGTHRGDVRGTVRFDGVRFGYQPDDPVLRGLDLEVAAGEKVALVGPTGAGKSTIIKLLSRVWDVDDGRVLLDGVDVREWALPTLRGAVGVVLQDVVLFSGTVRDNVTLGVEGVPDSVVRKAIERVGASQIVEGIGGLDGQLRERGKNLSMGERQLLALARVLVYDPRVLVLDEATSNVDTFAEERLQRAVGEAMRGRTAIVIAHRLSTIRQVDRIAVLRAGQVIEQGPHRELYARDGLYRRLYDGYFGGAGGAIPVA